MRFVPTKTEQPMSVCLLNCKTNANGSRYCFAGSSAGAAGAAGSAAFSDGAAQSPAHILVPFTVPMLLPVLHHGRGIQG